MKRFSDRFAVHFRAVTWGSDQNLMNPPIDFSRKSIILPRLFPRNFPEDRCQSPDTGLFLLWVALKELEKLLVAENVRCS
jgi:hypothetical protein